MKTPNRISCQLGVTHTNGTSAERMQTPVMADQDLRGAQNRISQAIAFGLREAPVPYVVNLSSIGAEVPYGTGPIAGLHVHRSQHQGLLDSAGDRPTAEEEGAATAHPRAQRPPFRAIFHL